MDSGALAVTTSSLFTRGLLFFFSFLGGGVTWEGGNQFKLYSYTFTE